MLTKTSCRLVALATGIKEQDDVGADCPDQPAPRTEDAMQTLFHVQLLTHGPRRGTKPAR